MPDDATKSDVPSPKAEPETRLTDAELSRIAREAVHQPADARLDKQLVRLGVMDAPEAEAPPAPTPAPAASPTGTAASPTGTDAEFERLRTEYERLREDLGRSMMLVRVLIGVLVVLAIVVVVLLVR